MKECRAKPEGPSHRAQHTNKLRHASLFDLMCEAFQGLMSVSVTHYMEKHALFLLPNTLCETGRTVIRLTPCIITVIL